MAVRRLYCELMVQCVSFLRFVVLVFTESVRVCVRVCVFVWDVVSFLLR